MSCCSGKQTKLSQSQTVLTKYHVYLEGDETHCVYQSICRTEFSSECHIWKILTMLFNGEPRTEECFMIWKLSSKKGWTDWIYESGKDSVMGKECTEKY